MLALCAAASSAPGLVTGYTRPTCVSFHGCDAFAACIDVCECMHPGTGPPQAVGVSPCLSARACVAAFVFRLRARCLPAHACMHACMQACMTNMCVQPDAKPPASSSTLQTESHVRACRTAAADAHVLESIASQASLPRMHCTGASNADIALLRRAITYLLGSGQGRPTAPWPRLPTLALRARSARVSHVEAVVVHACACVCVLHARGCHHPGALLHQDTEPGG